MGVWAGIWDIWVWVELEAWELACWDECCDEWWFGESIGCGLRLLGEITTIGVWVWHGCDMGVA